MYRLDFFAKTLEEIIILVEKLVIESSESFGKQRGELRGGEPLFLVEISIVFRLVFPSFSTPFWFVVFRKKSTFLLRLFISAAHIN